MMRPKEKFIEKQNNLVVAIALYVNKYILNMI